MGKHWELRLAGGRRIVAGAPDGFTAAERIERSQGVRVLAWRSVACVGRVSADDLAEVA